MCTVVCRWEPGESFAVQMLALRDERVSRAFDLPGEWWPNHPGVIGGRDRQAGGSWCVSEIASGRTAVVLNRPERRDATAGAPSRGTLPLLAIEHGRAWPSRLELDGMASFNLALVDDDELVLWSYDGVRLEETALSPGTHIITPLGRKPELPDRRLGQAQAHLDGRLDAPTDDVWTDWLAVLRDAVPSPDGTSLLAHRDLDDGDTYATVFGQLIAARPGTVRLDHQVDPASRGRWTTRVWSAD